VRIFAFVAAQKAGFPVRTLCRVCQVSPSGFYAWAARLAAGPGPAAVARAVTAGHIARVHAASRCWDGSPRVTAQLAREGITVNHKAVHREMARQGLAWRCSRRKIRTTRRDPSQVPAADLVHRDFTRRGTDELQLGDATYIWTDEGRCYLATVAAASSSRTPESLHAHSLVVY
jgi:putative transposase